MATAIILVATGEVGGHILNETLKSASSFSRAFKKWTGMTITEYKNSTDD